MTGPSGDCTQTRVAPAHAQNRTEQGRAEWSSSVCLAPKTERGRAEGTDTHSLHSLSDLKRSRWLKFRVILVIGLCSHRYPMLLVPPLIPFLSTLIPLSLFSSLLFSHGHPHPPLLSLLASFAVCWFDCVSVCHVSLIRSAIHCYPHCPLQKTKKHSLTVFVMTATPLISISPDELRFHCM